MKLKLLASIALLGLGGQAIAAPCTSTTSLGSLGPPGSATFGNSFAGGARSFNDCYTFSLSGSANTGGEVGAFDLALFANIALASVTLSGGSLGGPVIDTSVGSFGYSGLLAGSYSLAIAGSTSGFNLLPTLGYSGEIQARTVRTAVPEPATLALLGLGLAGIGLARRKRAA